MPLDSSMQVKVNVGARELLTSGVVHVEGDDPILVQIANLKFAFNFKSDEAGIRYVGALTGDTLCFDLFNHKNALGEGKLAAVEIAKIGERPLSFTYFVNTVNADKNGRRFEYAFYLGEKL